MDRERHLYHVSIMKELDIILANAESHADGSKVAYFTSDRVYALVCCRGREENFVTMGLKDGVQHYYERFPDQLKIMYEGKLSLTGTILEIIAASAPCRDPLLKESPKLISGNCRPVL